MQLLLQLLHPCYHLADRHSGYVRNAFTAHPYILGFLSQAHAAAVRASGLALEAGKHNAVLNLGELLLLQHMEEVVQAVEIFITCPDELFLFGRESVERRMYRKIELRRVVDQFIPPGAHLLSAPAGNGVLIDAFRLVGYDQIHIYANNISESVAAGACAERVVEVEQVFAGFNELYAVSFKPLGEVYHLHVVG